MASILGNPIPNLPWQDKPAGFPTPKAPMGWMRGHVHCLWNFLDAVHNGRKAEPGLEQGIYLQYLLGKVRESADKGCRVTL